MKLSLTMETNYNKERIDFNSAIVYLDFDSCARKFPYGILSLYDKVKFKFYANGVADIRFTSILNKISAKNVEYTKVIQYREAADEIIKDDMAAMYFIDYEKYKRTINIVLTHDKKLRDNIKVLSMWRNTTYAIIEDRKYCMTATPCNVMIVNKHEFVFDLLDRFFKPIHLRRANELMSDIDYSKVDRVLRDAHKILSKFKSSDITNSYFLIDISRYVAGRYPDLKLNLAELNYIAYKLQGMSFDSIFDEIKWKIKNNSNNNNIDKLLDSMMLELRGINVKKIRNAVEAILIN